METVDTDTGSVTTTVSTGTSLDAFGRVLSERDAKLGYTNYEYGPFGQQRRVILPDGTI
ncbi:MAG TPA: hypothetical protein PKA58_20215 [Polyangium sp.]|nr:hypothetical protein [Polyangium sp.]